VLDTASTRSIIDSGLASTLHLGSAGSAALGGSGCATSGTLVNVPASHLRDIALAAQPMVSTSLSNWAGQSVDGVLGSDVLGRFGAFKLDLATHTLTVPNAEGAPPADHYLVVGKPGASPPASLLNGAPATVVPLSVIGGPGTIAAYAHVSVAGAGSYGFLVSTGSPTSSIASVQAETLNLAPVANGSAPGAVGCNGSVPITAPTAVSADKVSANLALRSMSFPGLQRTGIAGALGIDFLDATGTVIVDYSGANLAFVSKGHTAA
jgi:hypothetical protein